MEKKRAVFIDLQGTLGGEGKGDIMEFAFFPFAYEALRILNERGCLAIIITNQAHISKGYFTYADYERKAEELKKLLNEKNAYINGIYCCPHMPKDHCSCMKPMPGMIEQALKDFEIDIMNSYVIGDMGESDMLLAMNTGMKGILVKTGGGEVSLTSDRELWTETEPYFVAEHVLEAVKYICFED